MTGITDAPVPAGEAAAGTGLRRFARPPRPSAGTTAEDRCELCAELIGREHKHMVDLQRRSIACACTACALLFTRAVPVQPGLVQPVPAQPGPAQPGPAQPGPGQPGPGQPGPGQPGPAQPVPAQPGTRYRTVPDRVLQDPAAPLTEAEWAELSIPVSVAFFFVNSALGRVIASYPSPAGVTECELSLEAWTGLAAAHPLLRALEPDVEAILVTGGESVEAFLVPIDACYRLAGALRREWRGFDGGAEVRQIMADLLAGLRRRARPLETAATGPEA